MPHSWQRGNDSSWEGQGKYWKDSKPRDQHVVKWKGQCATKGCNLGRWSEDYAECCNPCRKSQRTGQNLIFEHHSQNCRDRQKSMNTGKPREKSEPRDQRPPGGDGGNGDQGGNGNGGNGGHGWSWNPSYSWQSKEGETPWQRQDGGNWGDSSSSWEQKSTIGRGLQVIQAIQRSSSARSMEEMLSVAKRRRVAGPVRGPRSSSRSPERPYRQTVSGAPQHFNRGRGRDEVRVKVVTGVYNNSDRQKAIVRIERKEAERQGTFFFTSRACRKCQGLHCLYIVEDTVMWWTTEWHCPSDMVTQQHKDGTIDRGCNQIKRIFEAEGRSCEFLDPVHQVKC